MALSIRNGETDRLVRELAALTGEDLTDAITVAVRERLERVRQRPMRAKRKIFDDLMHIAKTAPEPIDARGLDELITDEDWGLAD